MPSRRQIREAVVQFLYCADLEGGGDPTALRESFWRFVTESDRKTLALAIWKGMRHLAKSREERHDEFLKRLPDALEALAGEPSLESGATLLERIASLEHEWSSRLHALSNIRRDDDADLVTERFTDGIERLFSIERDLVAARTGFLRILEDHPALRPRLEPIAGTLNRLARISERLLQLEHPEDFPEQSDFKKILSSKASIEKLRTEADRMADAVLGLKPQLDEQLNAVIENFAPERIDPIDRAILRLGAWEILHNPDVPNPVAINEAVDLAKEFGTTDSGRFVNGILDQIAKG
jgi:N utilization substance protein B